MCTKKIGKIVMGVERERERECTEVGTGRDDETFFSLPAGII